MVFMISGCSSGGDSAADGTDSASEESVDQVTLIVSAAASLTDALNEVEAIFGKEHPEVTLKFNYGASGALQKQIQEGAPADLFLSASPQYMNLLIEQGLVKENQQKTLLANTLVVVRAPDKGALTKLQDLNQDDVKHVTIGIPESVPAGSYAKEVLTEEGLWTPLQDKLVQAKDVRQVLQYVETGNADVGFVYKTDALTSDQVEIVFEPAPESYSSIEYPVGVVEASKHKIEAEMLLGFLQSEQAVNIFKKYGFSEPEQ
ncbi:molybdate ABC transporter substrate-binding protein [Paenibacillus lemnae]|uniref:Molybdate ABC transporter substrate-binding protein n=1 Tax=Paenibacillus lemnae TaxID=1330551 RepID=A0A848M6L7_PAELE|nr:molybdate ABC transporter substrate-binding protein [Paenibacillus lemnae]NMO95899.1 molybdate ABC transporter substrate-binding protein [Paenibacillus lemnae]